MSEPATESLAPVLYLPHGGGPLPILGDPTHARMVEFLKTVTSRWPTPDAIVLISAHWEQSQPAVTMHATPSLIYDYYNFPPESYEIQYPAKGHRELAEKTAALIEAAGIAVQRDYERGFDHGLFIPLKLMYPEANVPCIQLSLMKHLEPQAHIELGEAIRTLREQNVLILGSGMSFHNLRQIFSATNPTDERCERFDRWLSETCAGDDLSFEQRRDRLIQWAQHEDARYCHPREEHLLPLHVCFGAAGRYTRRAEQVFNAPVMNKRVSAFLW